MPDNVKFTSPPKREIDYQVDTLFQPSGAAAYFLPSQNTITQNYIVNKNNSYAQSAQVMAHEQKHRDNHAAKIQELPMNLEQHYKICCHNEISANLCEVLTLRQEYIEAENKSEVINKYKNTQFGAYFREVESGRINPLAIDGSKQFEEEMSFIANSTKDMWMKTFGEHYDDNHVSMCRSFLDRNEYSDLAKNDENYQKSKDICYTIGGINFSNYLTKDIPCINLSLQKADEMIMAKQKRSEVKRTVNYSQAYQRGFKFKSFENNDKLSLEQQYKLNQHKNIMDWIETRVGKYFTENCTPENCLTEAGRNNIKEEVENVANHLKNNGKFVEDLMDYQYNFAREKVLLPKGDERLYNEELKKIYTVNGVDIRKFYDNVDNILPDQEAKYIKEHENLSYYQRAKNYFKGVWYRKKAEEGSVKLYENPFHHGDPKYGSWSPKTRVSEIQKAKIIDFTKPYLKNQLFQLKGREELNSLVNSNKSGHSRIQEMRAKLAKGHDDKFAALKDNTRTDAERLAELRFSNEPRKTPVMARNLRKDVFEKLQARVNQ